MQKDRFSTLEVASIFGIKLNRLNNWLNIKLIAPSIEKASGYGTKNIFSFKDLCKISLFMKLLDLSISQGEGIRNRKFRSSRNRTEMAINASA